MSIKQYTQKVKKGKKLHDMISNFDMHKYIHPSLNIIESSRLHEYDYDQLFNNKFNASVVLIENPDGSSGHWILLNKEGRQICYFDSYGVPFEDSDIAFLKTHLGLTKVISNKTQFQKYSSEINTCGKHVLMRLLTFLEFKMNLSKHNAFIKKLCKKYKTTADELVTIFVPLD